jgi:predicted RNA-binding protein with PUA-like domain
LSRYWLIKSEPDVFSIEDLAAAPGRRSSWDGVRNYEARNNLRAMAVGDLAFLFHSNVRSAGVAGTVSVVKAAYPDPTQFDRNHPGYDPKSRPESPTWAQVDVRLVQVFRSLLAVEELRRCPPLAAMTLFKRGRLSVQPVTPGEWEAVLALVR